MINLVILLTKISYEIFRTFQFHSEQHEDVTFVQSENLDPRNTEMRFDLPSIYSTTETSGFY